MTSSNLKFPLHPSLNGVSGALNRTVNEQLIEQYVRYPESLEAVTLKTIGAALETGKREMAIERFYRQFYQEYDKLEGKISTSVSAFVNALF